jgi:hypothetical protein
MVAELSGAHAQAVPLPTATTQAMTVAAIPSLADCFILDPSLVAVDGRSWIE